VVSCLPRPWVQQDTKTEAQGVRNLPEGGFRHSWTVPTKRDASLTRPNCYQTSYIVT